MAWNNGRALRLMFQDEARFGRISDTLLLVSPTNPSIYACSFCHRIRLN